MSDLRNAEKVVVRFGKWAGHAVNPDGSTRLLTAIEEEILSRYDVSDVERVAGVPPTPATGVQTASVPNAGTETVEPPEALRFSHPLAVLAELKAAAAHYRRKHPVGMLGLVGFDEKDRRRASRRLSDAILQADKVLGLR